MQRNQTNQEQEPVFTELFRSHCSAGLFLVVATSPEPEEVLYAIVNRQTGVPRVMGNAPRQETIEATVYGILDLLTQACPQAVRALNAEAN